MWTFKAVTTQKGAKEAVLSSEGKPAVPVAIPPEFSGPENQWSPEDLLAASVGSCLMMSALYLFGLKKLAPASFEIETAAEMDKTDAGLAITRIVSTARIRPGEGQDADTLRELLHKAEASCPVSRALSVPSELEIDILSA